MSQVTLEYAICKWEDRTTADYFPINNVNSHQLENGKTIQTVFDAYGRRIGEPNFNYPRPAYEEELLPEQDIKYYRFTADDENKIIVYKKVGYTKESGSGDGGGGDASALIDAHDDDDNAHNGKLLPKNGVPVVTITPSTTANTIVEWKHDGIYEISLTDGMQYIEFDGDGDPNTISSFELHLIAPDHLVIFGWDSVNNTIIWPNDNGRFESTATPPPSFAEINTEYVIRIRYIEKTGKYYANIAYPALAE